MQQISRDMSDFHRHLVFKSVATSGKIYCQHGKESCRAVRGGGGGRAAFNGVEV